MDNVNENEAHAARERSELDHVITNVSDRFPTVARDRIESVVDDEVAQLEDAVVRDYVPILVEHETVDRLREEAEPVSLADRMGADADDAAATHDDAQRVGGDAETGERSGASGSAGPLLGGMRGGS